MCYIKNCLSFSAETPEVEIEKKPVISVDSSFEKALEELINMTIITVDKVAPTGKNNVMKSTSEKAFLSKC